ncbi:hypothetical protein KTR10_02710 [Candidatus Kaiserbacteria bacterium]|nr:hypothetical protein [Candidatus Kaiserbacteria bacterium]
MDNTTVKQEQNKTIVAFVLGLIIGGLLVWIFTPSTDVEVVEEKMEAEAMEEQTESMVMVAEEGSLSVSDQAAGEIVTFTTDAYPATGGWIAVREYVDNLPGNILGVARYNTEQGLFPTEVELLRGTEAGNTYRISFFTDNGDEEFDTGVDVEVLAGAAIFMAQ